MKADFEVEEDRERLSLVLVEIAETQADLTERFYELFFESRPDARPLFGVHSLAEREEMMHETFGSIHAWIEGEPWLLTNLEALGRSHWEYGVTADMYPSFVDTMIECAREVLQGRLDEGQLRVLRHALEEIVRPMRLAGDEASAAS